MPRTRAAAGVLSPQFRLEATTGFEPVMGVLQTPALPLGYVAPNRPIRPCSPILVPRRGFEPLRPKARPPQDRVSASSTTSAPARISRRGIRGARPGRELSMAGGEGVEPPTGGFGDRR